MSRPRKCKICNADLPTTGRVNSMLEARVKLKTIAAEIPQFSVSQLSKHRNRCRAPHSTVELAPDAGSDEHRVWAQRCTDAYHLAILNGDSRSAIAACSAATRQLVALAKKLEKERETEPADAQRADNRKPRRCSEGLCRSRRARAGCLHLLWPVEKSKGAT